MARVPQSLPQRRVLLVGLANAEDHTKCGNEDLASSKRADDPYPDLPIEADGPERGFDRVAEPATKAVAELLRRFLRIEGPKRVSPVGFGCLCLFDPIALCGVVLGDVGRFRKRKESPKEDGHRQDDRPRIDEKNAQPTPSVEP